MVTILPLHPPLLSSIGSSSSSARVGMNCSRAIQISWNSGLNDSKLATLLSSAKFQNDSESLQKNVGQSECSEVRPTLRHTTYCISQSIRFDRALWNVKNPSAEPLND